MLFILDYDLRKNRNYEALYESLRTFNAIKILESTWAFKRFGTSAVNLVNHFRQFVDTDDGLAVTEVKDWASYNVNQTPNDLR